MLSRDCFENITVSYNYSQLQFWIQRWLGLNPSQTSCIMRYGHILKKDLRPFGELKFVHLIFLLIRYGHVMRSVKVKNEEKKVRLGKKITLKKKENLKFFCLLKVAIK